MADILTELNEQANRICNELIAAKRAATANKGVKAAYQTGRAEALEEWLQHVEGLITKITDKRAEREGKKCR